jgi:hypothetical protein
MHLKVGLICRFPLQVMCNYDITKSDYRIVIKLIIDKLYYITIERV